MHLNISQLSELTGRDRRRIAKQLKDLQYTAGEWGAMLYGISRGAAARLCRGQSRGRGRARRASALRGTAKCNTS